MMDHARGALVQLAIALGLALAFAAVAAAGARAASTASLDPVTNTVTVVGGPEANHINTGGGLFGTMISDSAGIVAGSGCSQSDATHVSCGRYTTINADLGAGDDTIGTLLGPGTLGVFHGGPGNDTVYGDAGNSTIYGDAGNDNLSGGAGDDYIDGGPGHDTINGDGAYADPAEVGNDTINIRDGEQDQISCGYGWDTVTADPIDIVGNLCEQVDRGAAPPPPPPPPLPAMSVKLSAAAAHIGPVLRNGYAFNCKFGAAGRISTSIWLPASQVRKLHLGRKDLRIAGPFATKVHSGGYRITLHIRSSKYRAALRRASRVTVRVTMSAVDAAGHSASASRKVLFVR